MIYENSLVILGNGFDLMHGLETRFIDFIKSNHKFEEKYHEFCSEDGSWNQIEINYQNKIMKIIKERDEINILEEIDEIIDNCGLNDYGEVDYNGYSSNVYDDETVKLESYVNLIDSFEKDFMIYLKEKCSLQVLLSIEKFQDIYILLHMAKKIINFNYTDTVEELYGVSHVNHIHGDLHGKIAIGNQSLNEIKNSLIDGEYPPTNVYGNDKHSFQEAMIYYEEDMDGKLVKNHSIEIFYNEVVAKNQKREIELFELLDKKNKDSLEKRINTIKDLNKVKYSSVIIIGHSLGIVDYPVFDSINKDAIFYCYYHSQDDYTHMDDILKKLGVKYELICDNTLS